MTKAIENCPLYVFYGHHKCATMTINTIVGAVCRRLGMRFSAVFDEEGFDSDLAGHVDRNNIAFLSYGNADIAYTRNLPTHKGFHIIRDPRDIVVSAYYSHLYSHSTKGWKDLEGHRQKLQGLSADEGLLAEIEFRARSFAHLRSWDFDQENILEIRFEDFTRGSYSTLVDVFLFLELAKPDPYHFHDRFLSLYREFSAYVARNFGWLGPGRLGPGRIAVPDLLAITWQHSFQMKTRGRSVGEADEQSHYRKGKSGDWRNHFKEEHKRKFKSLYPGLVPSLGYHADDDW